MADLFYLDRANTITHSHVWRELVSGSPPLRPWLLLVVVAVVGAPDSPGGHLQSEPEK